MQGGPSFGGERPPMGLGTQDAHLDPPVVRQKHLRREDVEDPDMGLPVLGAPRAVQEAGASAVILLEKCEAFRARKGVGRHLSAGHTRGARDRFENDDGGVDKQPANKAWPRFHHWCRMAWGCSLPDREMRWTAG